MEKAAARRRRVPAFGEWNYYYYSGELATPNAATAAAGPEWCAAAPEMEASSDVWFRYSPPPRVPPPAPAPRGRKVRRPGNKTAAKSYSYGGGGKRATTPARVASGGVAPSSPAPAKATTGTATARAVVRGAVDADLYQVPPPDFAPDYGSGYGYEPRRQCARTYVEHSRQQKASTRSRRSWMGCFGFSCMRSC